MSEILKGTRKYGLGLTLAHQTLDQLRRDEEVYGAVTGNCGIKVCFQVGGDGARKMAEEFGGFQATDLMNLPSRSAIARVGPRGDAFNLEVPFLPEAERPLEEAYAEALRETRKRYCTPRSEIRAELAELRKGLSPEPRKDPFAELEAKKKKEKETTTEAATQTEQINRTVKLPPKNVPAMEETGASPNEGRPPSALPPRRTPTTLVSLGGATLCEALASPCETAILRIGAVETPDCLDVSVFPLCLLVRVIRRTVEQGFTECRPTGPQGLKLESYQVQHFSPIVLLESPASALLSSIRRRRSGSGVSSFGDAPEETPTEPAAGERSTGSPESKKGIEQAKAESIKNQIIQASGSWRFSYETEKPLNQGTGRVDGDASVNMRNTISGSR